MNRIDKPMGVPEHEHENSESPASRRWARTWPALVLLACGWWVVDTGSNAACTMHGSRGASLLLHKMCEWGGPWFAAAIPALVFAAAAVGVWFVYRAK